jgi:hypothetical protein
MKNIIALSVIVIALPVLAQESPSFKLAEHVFNAGGHPEAGMVMTSASFKVSLDSIGDGVAGTGLSGASFHMDAGFAPAYPPPGEVLALRFYDAENLQWDPERSAGVYNLYRNLMSHLSGLGYGDCHQNDIVGPTFADGDLPPGGDGYFYLVTAENRIGEEGTKGFDSDNVERANPSPCP